MPDKKTSIIGETLGRQPGRNFGIRQPDRLLHLFLVGQTGTGKSSLLLSMIKQDVAEGRGFCLVDPHGDLAEMVVRVANEAGRELINWNAADPKCLYGYNPLETVPASRWPLVASSLISTFKKQWPDAWGARMEHLLRFALLALLERPGSSIADILPLFLDKSFREEVLESVEAEAVRAFWTVEYKALRYQSSGDGVASIANKLGAFLAHPLVRRAVCEPPVPLNFRKLIDQGQGLVVNLAKGRLGEDVANLLGGLIVSGLATAAYSRQDTPESGRRPFFLYIDECHHVTTQALADMLSELRKYSLSITLSTQYTSRLGESVREAIFGNVGSMVAFRVGATDAALLAKQFAGDLPEPRDLTNLPNYEIYLKLMIDGVQSKPFSAVTLPPT